MADHHHPHAAAADGRGRQVAWLMIVAPYALACALVLTAINGQPWAWPWALALLRGLLGGAAPRASGALRDLASQATFANLII